MSNYADLSSWKYLTLFCIKTLNNDEDGDEDQIYLGIENTI